MTNITTLEKVLRVATEELLEKEDYTKTFFAEGIGSMWKKGNTVIDITEHAGHCNALMVIEPYITVRVDGEPHVFHKKEEIEELFATL